jgi:hypothetical protein
MGLVRILMPAGPGRLAAGVGLGLLLAVPPFAVSFGPRLLGRGSRVSGEEIPSALRAPEARPSPE